MVSDPSARSVMASYRAELCDMVCIYGAVWWKSYCSEQNAQNAWRCRMRPVTVPQSPAGRAVSTAYNRVRQAAITQETDRGGRRSQGITERREDRMKEAAMTQGKNRTGHGTCRGRGV